MVIGDVLHELQELDSVLHFLYGQQIVDQNKTPKQFSNGQRPREAISDSCVTGSFRMEPQKIGIVRNHNATVGRGKDELRRVIRAHQPGLRRSGPSMPRRRRPAATLVEICSSR
jgi:hypothetical protein